MPVLWRLSHWCGCREPNCRQQHELVRRCLFFLPPRSTLTASCRHSTTGHTAFPGRMCRWKPRTDQCGDWVPSDMAQVLAGSCVLTLMQSFFLDFTFPESAWASRYRMTLAKSNTHGAEQKSAQTRCGNEGHSASCVARRPRRLDVID
jgi:hypothetical protein